jgi:hypothetical protein
MRTHRQRVIRERPRRYVRPPSLPGIQFSAERLEFSNGLVRVRDNGAWVGTMDAWDNPRCAVHAGTYCGWTGHWCISPLVRADGTPAGGAAVAEYLPTNLRLLNTAVSLGLPAASAGPADAIFKGFTPAPTWYSGGMFAKTDLTTRILLVSAAAAAIVTAAVVDADLSSPASGATYLADGGPPPCPVTNGPACASAGPGGANATVPGAGAAAGQGGANATVPGAGAAAGPGGANANVPGAGAAAGPGGANANVPGAGASAGPGGANLCINGVGCVSGSR